ncbi:MBL fold metallo-hydrolase [Saccharolobus shibatae]|uniref:Metallo-beta-lactamase domain-containing protein n=1 Tax=Saccharolobus shibatae TaxID=2286 RepID=A0A8F5C0N1_9CREN|nr:MBL fold metallo-hydrolase [Saccharolobus shibatae]QXJ34999.1 hypothetical protein J5U22_01546 [Saccharolobus shibatae]
MEFRYENITIKILQGYGEIGGNCIIIENKDSKIVFDQGIRFSRFRRFYNANVQPVGFTEMINLGIIPDLTDLKDVFISHLHLDHLGLLHPLQLGTTVYVPNEQIFNAFIEPYKAANNWTTYISPSIGVDIVDVSKNNDNVIPLAVEHSAYPAFSYYYDTGNIKLLYTGDMRISSPLGALTPEIHKKLHEKTLLEEYEEKGLVSDVLIIEGTNFTPHTTPVSSHYFIEQISNIFQNHSNSLMFASIDSLDAEAILSILLIAKTYNRIPVITGRRLINMVKLWIDLSELSGDIYQLEDKVINFNIVEEDEIEKNPSNYLILSSKGEPLEFVRRTKIGKGSVIISLTAEAQSESGEDESVEDSWLKMLGFIVYRLRMSGHYYPYELKYILDVIRPKKVIPIHTEVPSIMCEYVSQLGYECLGRT